MRFSGASAQALLAAHVYTHYVPLSPRQETHFRNKATCFDHSILNAAAEHILLFSVRAEVSRAHLVSPFLFPKACTPPPFLSSWLAATFACTQSSLSKLFSILLQLCSVQRGKVHLANYLQEARSVPRACDTPSRASGTPPGQTRGSDAGRLPRPPRCPRHGTVPSRWCGRDVSSWCWHFLSLTLPSRATAPVCHRSTALQRAEQKGVLLLHWHYGQPRGADGRLRVSLMGRRGALGGCQELPRPGMVKSPLGKLQVLVPHKAAPVSLAPLRSRGGCPLPGEGPAAEILTRPCPAHPCARSQGNRCSRPCLIHSQHGRA